MALDANSRVLLIQKLPGYRLSIRTALSPLVAELRLAINGDEARALTTDITHIIVDPASVAADAFQQIRAACSNPAIVLSVAGDKPPPNLDQLRAEYGAIAASGRDPESIRNAFETASAELIIGGFEKRVAEQRQRLEEAKRATIDDIMAKERWQLALLERLEHQRAPSDAAASLLLVLNFGMWAGGSGVQCNVSRFSEREMRSIIGVFEALGWSDDAASLRDLVALAGGFSALGDDGAEIALLNGKSGRRQALEQRIRFQELEASAAAADLRKYVLANKASL